MNENIKNFNHTSLPDIDPAKLNLPESKVTDKEYVVQTIHVPLSLDHRLILIGYLVIVLICLIVCFLVFMGLTHKIHLLTEEVETMRTLVIYDTASVQNNALAVKQAAFKLEQLRRTEVDHFDRNQVGLMGQTFLIMGTTALALVLVAQHFAR